MAALHSIPWMNHWPTANPYRWTYKLSSFPFLSFNFCYCKHCNEYPAKKFFISAKYVELVLLLESKAMRVCNFVNVVKLPSMDIEIIYTLLPAGIEMCMLTHHLNHTVCDHFFFYFADISFLFPRFKKASHSFNSHFLYFEQDSPTHSTSIYQMPITCQTLFQTLGIHQWPKSLPLRASI